MKRQTYHTTTDSRVAAPAGICLQWDGHPARHFASGENKRLHSALRADDGQDARPTKRNSHAARRQQGSLLVLVVVCLVLMALLGTAYLQVARVDRLATADTYQSNIDQVASATINYIAKVLRDDLVDQNDAFFSQPSGSPYDDGSGDEPYDYPWTNSITYLNAWAVTFDDGSTANADGGILDDTWLASTIPTFSGTDATWPHISNLMGTFLRIPTGGSGLIQEEPTAVNDTTTRWRNDTLIPIDHTGGHTPLSDDDGGNMLPLGVDTDMDGIPDAKWQWAPLRQIGSVKYVMAVRIIDNSSLLNLATGSALSSDGDTVNTARGYFPSEIDLSRIVARMPSANWQQELATNANSLFNSRGLSAATVTPLGNPTISSTGLITWGAGTSSRAEAWFNHIQEWNNPVNKIALANEMELRRLGGVNNDRVITSLEEAMPTLLRQEIPLLPTETLYSNINGYHPSVSTDVLKRIAFFQGSNPSDASNPNASVADRQYPSLRNQFTTQSAATLFAGNYADIGKVNYETGSPTTFTHAPHRLKYDLVHQDGGSDTSPNVDRIEALYKRIHRILTISDSGGTNAYLGLNTTTDAAELSDMALEYALAIQDYSDADRIPSSPPAASPAGRMYYGLEMLPFFREAYIQAAYQNTDLRDSAGDPNPDNIPDTWVYDAGSAALAFEIANPFDKTINFDESPAIRVQVGSNHYPLTGTLASHHKRVLYANTPAGSRRVEGPETTPRGDLVADLGLAPKTDVDLVPLTEGVTDILNTEIVFELQVEVATGTWVTYDRLRGSLAVPANPVEYGSPIPYTDPLAPAADIGLYHFKQFNLARAGSHSSGVKGPYYLSNDKMESASIGPVVNQATFTANYARFTEDDKGVGGTPIEGDSSLELFQLPNANRQFLSVAELGWVPMFGFYTNSGNTADDEIGDFPARMTALAENRRSLDLSGSVIPSQVGMSHAALLFDQFTTISPRNDSEDNDGDGVDDNDAEQFVRGQININTAPLHILTLGAPLNESIADIEDLMRTIIHYRDNPGHRNTMTGTGTTPVRSTGGIASIGELTHLNGAFAAPPPADIDMATNPPNRIDGYAIIDPVTFKDSNRNLYPLPENASAQNQPSPQDGNEQKLARFQFLSQVFNTRSDTFTAFVRLRGYPANDFSHGEVESRNFLVVYDRSNIITASDMPRIIGVYVYNVP